MVTNFDDEKLAKLTCAKGQEVTALADEQVPGLLFCVNANNDRYFTLALLDSNVFIHQFIAEYRNCSVASARERSKRYKHRFDQLYSMALGPRYEPGSTISFGHNNFPILRSASSSQSTQQTTDTTELQAAVFRLAQSIEEKEQYEGGKSAPSFERWLAELFFWNALPDSVKQQTPKVDARFECSADSVRAYTCKGVNHLEALMLSASILAEQNRSALPEWLSLQPTDDNLRTRFVISEINLSYSHLSDTDFDKLHPVILALPDAFTLSVKGTLITNKSMHLLGQLGKACSHTINIKSLDLSETNVNDDGLLALKNLALESLTICNTTIKLTDNEIMNHFPTLKVINR
ncbi:MAG: hypothetical protein K2W95_31915 [Candidatus Obscuribacterales bacterium]|nr:hypothetical protein [Candidatus Obscuribacterales bacterium]